MRTTVSFRRVIAAVSATALLAGGVNLVASPAQAAALAITFLADPVTQANDEAVILRGTAAPADVLTVTVTSTGGGTFTPKAVAVSGETFETSLDTRPLNDGLLTVTVSRTGGGEAVQTTTKDTVGPGSPVLVSVTDPVNGANAGSFTASGTAEPGATVTVTVTDSTTDALGQPDPRRRPGPAWRVWTARSRSRSRSPRSRTAR